MKSNNIIISTLVTTLFLALIGISLADEAREIDAIPIDKGIELYSWKGDNNWMFVMMDGTNRAKSAEEVKEAKGQIKGVVALKQIFGKFAKNQYVSWSNRGLKGFEYPPKTIREEIVAAAREAGIDLSVEEEAREIDAIPIDKGIELYSWKDDNNWMFVMMDGTNRAKSAEEVKEAKGQIKGVVALKQTFGKFAKNQYVSWSNRGLKGFEYPPKTIREEIVAAAREAEIDLSVEEDEDQ